MAALERRLQRDSEQPHMLLMYKPSSQASPRLLPGVPQFKRLPTANPDAACEVLLDMCENELAYRRSNGRRVGAGDASEGAPIDQFDMLRYDAADLLNFMDSTLEELSILVFQPDGAADTTDGSRAVYVPRGRTWVKNRLFAYLRGRLPSTETVPIEFRMMPDPTAADGSPARIV